MPSIRLSGRRDGNQMSKLNEIADYAQGHDFAAEMDKGMWEADTDADPMITTPVRLPKSLLDWTRHSQPPDLH